MTDPAPVHSDLAIPPGEFLVEVIAKLDISSAELAYRTKLSVLTVQETLGGRVAIGSDIALRLKRVTRVPAHIWLGLESELYRARAREAYDLDSLS